MVVIMTSVGRKCCDRLVTGRRVRDMPRPLCVLCLPRSLWADSQVTGTNKQTYRGERHTLHTLRLDEGQVGAGWLVGWLAGWLAGLCTSAPMDRHHLLSINHSLSGYLQ